MSTKTTRWRWLVPSDGHRLGEIMVPIGIGVCGTVAFAIFDSGAVEKQGSGPRRTRLLARRRRRTADNEVCSDLDDRRRFQFLSFSLDPIDDQLGRKAADFMWLLTHRG